MNKSEYQMYERTLRTAERLEKIYYKQKEELVKLFDYLELRKEQLEYAESKEEVEFIQSYIDRIRKLG